MFNTLMFAVLMAGQTITDPGFETPAQAYGKFAYAPAGSAWTFTTGGGLAANASGFTAYNPGAPQGGQVCFLQSRGSVAQTVKGWTAGDYQVSFKAAQRGSVVNTHQVIDVLLDGAVVSTIAPGSISYQTYYTVGFPVSAGDHTLTFRGTNTTGDHSAFLDAVSIVPAGSVAATVSCRAIVATSGKMVSFAFATISDGKPTTPTQVMRAPSVSVNGRALGRMGVSWVTGYHPVMLVAMPDAYQIRPGDRVTITAPAGWAVAGASGFVQGLDGLIAENRAGKPMLATESLARTLRIGINHNLAPTSANLGFYWPFTNIKYKVGWWPGNRGKITSPSMEQPITQAGTVNGIDSTGYPGQAGLWLVMWDAATPDSPVAFGITTHTPGKCTVTERADLARAPPDGIGRCRVFDVQPTPRAAVDFEVWLSYNDPTYTGVSHYNNLWVVQPGDFDIIDGQVVLDRSDPLALSRTYRDRVGPDMGSMRWVDSTVCGGNPRSTPYPEFLPSPNDENWGDLSFYREIRGYTAAGPVDVKATPWIYSPFFRQPGQSYTCTLGAAVTTTPAVGTREVWTITDGAEAPLMAGLEITADSEVCRILSGSGTAWTVVRGSNGTTPATHQPGALSVSGRLPIRNVLDANGTRGGALTVQLTTREPHARTHCNIISCGGGGWPNMTFTNGSTWNPQGGDFHPYVTGPNTLVVLGSCTGAGGVPTQVYPLNPDVQQWEYRANCGIPIECAAIATGKFAHADFHVNIPIDACDDMVYELARRVLANFPAGRRVYIEYSNEPWNWGFVGPFYHNLMGSVVPGNPYQLAHYAMRSGQVHAIFRTVFGAAGRAGEIRGIINCQMGSGSTQVTPHLEYGLKAGTPFDCVAVAPYWDTENTALNKQVAAFLDDEQFLDVVSADMRTNTRLNNAWMADVNSAIAKYNQAHGASVTLYGYEGGASTAAPGDNRRNHDLIYNPNFYFVELDWIAWCQQAGFERINVYSLAQYWGPEAWGGYHTTQQVHSRGDGLNGAANNLAVKARSKPANVNQDLQCDSVRAQAWLDWLGTLQP